jgi:plasmid maintenance system antidote protein VapI|tara:strand:+ start:97 stop:312 length:216 start_codon:yes stop_codon:yes gene_type:complete
MNKEFMKYYDIVAAKYPGSTDRKMAELLGYKQSYIQMIRKGDRNISTKFADKFYLHFGKLPDRTKLIYGND